MAYTDDSNPQQSSPIGNAAKKAAATGAKMGIKGGKEAAKRGALAAATGGGSTALDAAQAAQKGMGAAKKGAQAAKKANDARNKMPGKNNDFADQGAHKGWGGNARKAADKGLDKALKVSGPQGQAAWAAKKAGKFAIANAKNFAKSVQGKASETKQTFAQKAIIFTPIAFVGFLLLFTIGAGMGGGADEASAEELPPGVMGTVTVNEEELKAALENPLLKGVDPDFLRAEVITAARMEALVPGCRMRWQVMHAIAMHETGSMLSWPINENGDEEKGKWKIGGQRFGPDGSDNPPSPWYRDADGTQWDLSETDDFAVGAYQMAPQTWAGWKTGRGGRSEGMHMDGNGDGIQSPHNTYDAFAASAKNLCPASRDADPLTINDYSDASTTDWTTLNASLVQYSGGAYPDFPPYVKEHTAWLDAIKIGVTVSVNPGDAKLPPGVNIEDLPASLQIVVAEATTTGMNKPYTQDNPARKGTEWFDCSGLTWYIYHKAGIEIHDLSGTQQALDGVPVLNKSDLRPGDLVFFSSNPGIEPNHHVGVYIGNQMMVNAHTFGKLSGMNNIFTESYYVRQYNGAVRIVNPDGSLARRS